jgi:hypothetical protein
MLEYFRLESPDSDRLSASNTREDATEVLLCPATSGLNQHRSIRRIGDLDLEVKHSRRDQSLIFAHFDGMVVHARLLEAFEKRGFTGYRLSPATVRFRDGYLSHDYSKLIVTGWAGVAPPESGIELLAACAGCGYKKYSSLKHPEHLIDWAQWTGEDFFMVWPLPSHTMITKRVADALAELNAQSYQLDSMVKPRAQRFSFNFGYSVGPLSQFLPEDLAVRYGAPLRLECDPGFYPAMEERPREEESPRFPRCSPTDDPTPASVIAGLSAIAGGKDTSRYDVASQCLELLQNDQLKSDDVTPHAPTLLAIWNSAHAELKPRQQQSPSNEWLLDDGYRQPRALGEVILDVLGYVPGDAVSRALNDALALNDPRLKTFAILSLLRHGACVDPDQIEQAAASLEMRMIFARQLQKLDCLWLMPEQWMQPWLLGASDLCNWAAHPNELGVPPEEVEPMATFALQPGNEIYLFRFREYPKPWEPGEGWMAGIAGPFKDGVSQESPWSSFKRWDSMTPQQHFMKLYYRGSRC